jgi:hypothetical protein
MAAVRRTKKRDSNNRRNRLPIQQNLEENMMKIIYLNEEKVVSKLTLALCPSFSGFSDKNGRSKSAQSMALIWEPDPIDERSMPVSKDPIKRFVKCAAISGLIKNAVFRSLYTSG